MITVDITETKEAAALFAGKSPFLPLVRRRLIGDAKTPEVVREIKAEIAEEPGSILVFLDDWHDGDNLFAELDDYAPLVTEGSFLIVADTTFADLAGTPLIANYPKYADYEQSNPRQALYRFLATNHDFTVVTDYTRTAISNFPDSVRRTSRTSPHEASFGVRAAVHSRIPACGHAGIAAYRSGRTGRRAGMDRQRLG